MRPALLAPATLLALAACHTSPEKKAVADNAAAIESSLENQAAAMEAAADNAADRNAAAAYENAADTLEHTKSNVADDARAAKRNVH